MSAKVILVFCAQALFVQLALSACAGHPYLEAGLGYNGIGYGNTGIGYGCGLGYGAGAGYGGLAIEVIPTSGGSLPVTSTSLITPTGLSVVSENIFEGSLYVNGELPFASTVALESVLPSAGAGAVSYSCGNGITAIESIAPTAVGTVAPIAPAYGAGIGAYGAGIAPLSLLPGVGCNAPVAGFVAPIDGCYPGGIFY